MNLSLLDPHVGRSAAGGPPSPTSAEATRISPDTWPATRLSRPDASRLLGKAALVVAPSATNKQHVGTELVLDWLAEYPGENWQRRWLATGADPAGTGWRDLAVAWSRSRGHGPWRGEAMTAALPVVISADLLRPSLGWLVGGGMARGRMLVRAMAAIRDPAGFTRLQIVCDQDPSVSSQAASQTVFRCAQLLAAQGGTLTDIDPGSIVELFAAERAWHPNPSSGRGVFYRLLREVGALGVQAPATLRGLRTVGQRTPAELIDRYNIAPGPIRDLLVDYLRERQPALDYTSLQALSYCLGKLFWADIQAHHPDLTSLHLPGEVAEAWKRRLRTRTTTVTTPDGAVQQVSVDRINYRECLTPVRAFYLDLAHWAVTDPGRWGPWAAPCPVGDEEVHRAKDKQRRKSRIDTRTRQRLPALPALLASVNDRRNRARLLLETAQATPPGQVFTADGVTLRRSTVPRGGVDTVWAEDPEDGRRRSPQRRSRSRPAARSMSGRSRRGSRSASVLRHASTRRPRRR